jgi:hypothetical protein
MQRLNNTLRLSMQLHSMQRHSALRRNTLHNRSTPLPPVAKARVPAGVPGPVDTRRHQRVARRITVRERREMRRRTTVLEQADKKGRITVREGQETQRPVIVRGRLAAEARQDVRPTGPTRGRLAA